MFLVVLMQMNNKRRLTPNESSLLTSHVAREFHSKTPSIPSSGDDDIIKYEFLFSQERSDKEGFRLEHDFLCQVAKMVTEYVINKRGSGTVGDDVMKVLSDLIGNRSSNPGADWKSIGNVIAHIANQDDSFTAMKDVTLSDPIKTRLGEISGACIEKSSGDTSQTSSNTTPPSVTPPSNNNPPPINTTPPHRKRIQPTRISMSDAQMKDMLFTKLMASFKTFMGKNYFGDLEVLLKRNKYDKAAEVVENGIEHLKTINRELNDITTKQPPIKSATGYKIGSNSNNMFL